MDKLIITILGIALSGVALLWTTDYLSSTYTNAQAAAKAQKWIADAAQVAVAARQAGSLSLASDNWQQGSSTAPTAAALVTAYLTDLPKHNGVYVFLPCYVTAGTTSCPRYVTDTTHATDATIIEAPIETVGGLAICTAINQIANRGSTGAPPTSTYSAGVFSYTLPVNSNQQFACVNASGTYYFLYRVFMDR